MVHADESDACGNRAQSSAVSTHKPERQTLQVTFSTVTVYLFQRAQGSETVPTDGAQSLGMAWTHHSVETFDLNEDGVANKSRKSLTEISERFRLLLLTDAGVHFDQGEADENEQIRESRRNVGCTCADGICSPTTCTCALEGISCMRSEFGCSCTKQECSNPEGHIQFDPEKAHRHFTQIMNRQNKKKSGGRKKKSGGRKR